MGDWAWPSSILRSLCPFRLALRQDGAQYEAGNENGEADQHARRKAVVNMVGRVITAEVFHERAGDGITDEVGGEDLSVEFFVPEQPRQQEVKQDVIHRIID